MWQLLVTVYCIFLIYLTEPTFSMASKLQPPKFVTGKCFELYKQELLAWQKVTDLDLKKQGIYIALSLPDGDESKIREKVFETLGVDKLDADNGLKELLDFMNIHLGKDDLEDAWNKFEEFEDYRRVDENMTQFISCFDQKYQRVKAKGLTLPVCILAFKLLKSAMLSKEEKLLVMTGLDFSKKDDLYEDAKKSLRKFKGETVGSGYSGSAGNDIQVKVEPVFYTTGRGFRGRGNTNRGWRGRDRGYKPRDYGNYGRGNVRGDYGNYGRGSARSDGYPRDAGTAFRRSGRGQGEKDLNPLGKDGLPIKCDRCESIRHLFAKCTHRWETSGKLNPVGKDGNYLKCDSCESVLHLLAKCPHRWEVINQAECVDEQAQSDFKGQFDFKAYPDEYTEHVVLFTGFNKADVVQLEAEAHNSGVLDSACTSTVSGRVWVHSYIETLSESDKVKVVKLPSNKRFKFGSGNVFPSEGEYLLPACLAGKSVTVKTDVVECDIPLLFSRTALKSMGAKVDYENDVAVIFGRTVQLNFTSSGHHCISLVPDAPEDVNAIDLNEVDDKCKYKVVLKLHRQFGHPSKVKLEGLLKDAGIWTAEYSSMLSDIHDKCRICKEFSSTPPRSVVCLPMARNFNEKVAMDLKHWRKGLWILYMIDLYSRYTMATFITRKLPSTIIDNVIKYWIRIFGVMGGILTDNGGEFNADEVRDVASVLDVKVATTGADSPFQNGMCERVHSVTDMILHKLEAEYPNTSLEVLLAWACMAKNCLQMFNGFSANQLVFGRNPNLPNVLSDNVAALDGKTQSEVFAYNLNILHASRRAFIKSESEERIRRALRHKVRVNEQSFKNGDSVFYKRDNQTRWLGPGKVLGQDGKIIFVRHGGVLVRVSANRITDANNVQFDNSQDNSLVGCAQPVVNAKDNNELTVPSFVEILDKNDDNANNETGNEREEIDAAPLPVAEGNNHVADDGIVGKEPERRSLRQFNKIHGSEVYIVNLPRSRHKDSDCVKAKIAEMEKLREYKVYEEVPFYGQQCISTRWIVWEKGEAKEVRARLVARGFEEDVDLNVDSPTIGKDKVRIVLAIAASLQWTIKSTDIKSAFLQGNALERDVFLKPPSEAKVPDNMVWKLNRCLYGLNDAARQFYNSVVTKVTSLGCEKSRLEPSLFINRKNGVLAGVLCSHIDDFLHAGTSDFEDSVLNPLCQRFIAGKRQETAFKYVGYQLTQLQSGNIVMDQNSYVESIIVHTLSAERQMQKLQELTGDEMTKYRSMVGSLNWIVHGTRPDMAFQLLELSTKFKGGTVDDFVKVQKILQKAKCSTSSVMFPRLGDLGEWKIVVWADASHGNLCDSVASCTGYIIFLVGQSGQSCPVTWRSRKVRRVVKSTIAAEGYSLSDALDDGVYLKKLICEVTGLDSVPVIGYTDHEGLYKNIRSTKLVEDKLLRLEVAAIRESIEKEDVTEVRLCSTHDQLADCLTKKGVNPNKILSVLQTGRMLIHV